MWQDGQACHGTMAATRLRFSSMVCMFFTGTTVRYALRRLSDECPIVKPDPALLLSVSTTDKRNIIV